MASDRLNIVADVTYRTPGWQGMVMQLEDTCNKIERMRHAVAKHAGCSPEDVEVVLDDTQPVLHIRPRGYRPAYSAAPM